MEYGASVKMNGGKVAMRYRRDSLYRSVRSRWQRQRAAGVEAITLQAVVCLIKMEKTHIMLQLLFPWFWLQRAKRVTFATERESSGMNYLSRSSSKLFTLVLFSRELPYLYARYWIVHIYLFIYIIIYIFI